MNRTSYPREVAARKIKPKAWTARRSRRPLRGDQFTLPLNADPITNFTAGPGNGAWFWNVARNGAYLFHITPTTVTKWRLPRTGHAEAESPPGIAQAEDGSLWVGVDQTVYSLDPHTNRVRAWTLPVPTQDPAARPGGPPIPSAIDSLAVSPSGIVAVTERLANEVTELDPATGIVDEIKMPNPKRDEAFSVAFSRRGVLAAGFGDFHPTSNEKDLLLISSDKAQHVRLRRAGASLAVAADGWQFFSGLNPAEIVNPATGKSHLTKTPSRLRDNGDAPQTLIRHEGNYYAARSTEVVDFAPSSRRVKTTWPVPNDTYTCEPEPGSVPARATTTSTPSTPTSSPTTQTCSYEIQLYGIDGSGNVWVVTEAHNQGTVRLLKRRH